MNTLLKNLTIKNNFMFAAVMSDEENCKGFLERVLPIKINYVEINTEKNIVYHPEYKGVRLDVYAKDENNTRYNIEMQVLKTTDIRTQKSVTRIKASREMEERFMLLEELLKDEYRQGMQKGELKATREILEMALERFGQLPESFLTTLYEQQDIELIRNWIQTALTVKSLDEFISKIH